MKTCFGTTVTALSAFVSCEGFSFYFKASYSRAPHTLQLQSDDKEKGFIEWMEKDCLDEIDFPGRLLTVQGRIPQYVVGTYVKNGPGAFKTKTGKRRYTHAFDGLAKLIKFTFYETESGTIGVSFMTKFLDSLVRKCSLDLDWMLPSVTTGPVAPPWTPLEGLLASFLSVPLFDNTPVNVERISSSSTFAAVTDAPVTMSFDIHTLETLGKVKYRGGIKGLDGFALFSTAHSKVGVDGLTYNYFLEITPNGLFANLVRTNKDFTQTSIGKVSTDGNICYVHDISLTEHYAVIVIYPLNADPTAIASGSGFLSQLRFDSSSSSKIHVFSLASETPMEPVATFETQPFFAYHHVNAYEDSSSNSIVLDILAYENGDIANSAHGFLYMNNMQTKSDRVQQVRESNIWRFHLPMQKNQYERFVTPTKTSFILSDGDSFGFELATLSPLVQGWYYRYCYGFSGHYKGKEDFLDWAIVKQDVQSGKGNAVWYEEYSYPGEPIFVPDPKSMKEDGGVLLSSVYDSRKRENFLLVLDAETMKEVARAYTGTIMYVCFECIILLSFTVLDSFLILCISLFSRPNGFHGKFFN